MKGMSRVVRILRNNPRYLCQYLVWTNILVFLYFVINADNTNTNIDHILVQHDQGVGTNVKESGATVLNEGKYKFEHFELSKWNENQHFRLTDSGEEFFTQVGDSECYTKGTDLEKSLVTGACECHQKYFGPHCGIPQSAWESFYKNHRKAANQLRPRKVPRRLIHGLQVNHEFEMFEARLEMLKDVVDVYLLLESNYTAYGSGKQLSFLDKFRGGWLQEYQSKIQYIFLSFFPPEAETNGWYADSFLRFFLGKEGMKMVDDVRDDDVFLLLDADELPTPESLIFLKIFDGWTEPVKFGFRWNVFGFFWLEAEEPSGLMSGMLGRMLGVKQRKTERLLTLYVACTVATLRQVYGNNAMSLRKNVWNKELLKKGTANYTTNLQRAEIEKQAKHQGIQLSEWTLGNSPHYAGWHCSWCYPPAGIKIKLQSAQRHDKPRWGDFPDKLNLDYIASLIRNGEWFDGKHPLIPVNRRNTSASVYAPPFFLENEDRFEHLLVHPDDMV